MLAPENNIRQGYLQLIEREGIINNRYSNVRRIDLNGGNGHFSLLFKAFDTLAGRDIALKFFDPQKISDYDRVQRFHREAEMLDHLSPDPYVINRVDGLCTLGIRMINPATGDEIPYPPFIYFAMELADSNVEDLIYKRNPDALSILLYFKEMLKSVFRIHNKNVCHRDLKPSNFLILGKDIRLSDFGTSKIMDGSMPDIRRVYQDPVGDLFYSAPELFFSIGIADEYVFKADIFAMGAILFEMFTNTVLTDQIYSEDVLDRLTFARQLLTIMTPHRRLEAYLDLAADVERFINFPDIYSYNDNIPNCIKNHLNDLYKSLSHTSLLKRSNNPVSIHRKIDICIKILKNEKKYLKWKEEKRRRRLIKL
ncbi:MAG: serine/threonine protein kinase [Candidatus Heimdallarchaeota archaeon]